MLTSRDPDHIPPELDPLEAPDDTTPLAGGPGWGLTEEERAALVNPDRDVENTECPF